jgi:predicted metal-dependent hydrolase
MRGRRRDYLRYKEDTRALVHARIAHYVALGEVAPKAVRIRNSKTRWGSCSVKGNLNFHYKLVLLPPELADYVIVHELCHLQELNHSERFWALVARYMPEHRRLRRELNTHARALR